MSVKIGEMVIEIRARATEMASLTGESFDATWRRIVAVLNLPEEEIRQIHAALLDMARPTPEEEAG